MWGDAGEGESGESGENGENEAEEDEGEEDEGEEDEVRQEGRLREDDNASVEQRWITVGRERGGGRGS